MDASLPGALLLLFKESWLVNSFIYIKYQFKKGTPAGGWCDNYTVEERTEEKSCVRVKSQKSKPLIAERFFMYLKW
jgi:hypothetical protein